MVMNSRFSCQQSFYNEYQNIHQQRQQNSQQNNSCWPVHQQNESGYIFDDEKNNNFKKEMYIIFSVR